MTLADAGEPVAVTGDVLATGSPVFFLQAEKHKIIASNLEKERSRFMIIIYTLRMQ